MGLREIFRLEESTERLARGIYNFLFRVAVFSIAILTLVGVGIGVSFVVIQGGVLIGLDAKDPGLSESRFRSSVRIASDRLVPVCTG